MAEALQWLCRAEPTSKDMIEALHGWTAKTPARAALLQARTSLKLHILAGLLSLPLTALCYAVLQACTSPFASTQTNHSRLQGVASVTLC